MLPSLLTMLNDPRSPSGSAFAHTTSSTQRVARVIELMRFPVLEDNDHAEIKTEPGRMRVADLAGQLGGPLYPRKPNALMNGSNPSMITRWRSTDTLQRQSL